METTFVLFIAFNIFVLITSMSLGYKYYYVFFRQRNIRYKILYFTIFKKKKINSNYEFCKIKFRKTFGGYNFYLGIVIYFLEYFKFW